MARLQGAQRSQKMFARVQRMRLQPLLNCHVQRGQPGSACSRAAAKRAEVLHAICKTIRDLPRGDHRTHRVAVANWFAQHDDVRLDRVLLECPKVRADAPEPRLHFIRNAHTACRPHQPVYLRKVAGRQHDLPGHARAGFGDKCAQAVLLLLQLRDDAANMRCILRACICNVRSILAAVNIGDQRFVHPCRCAAAARAIVFVRADVDQGAGVSVVRGVHHNQLLLACVGAGQAQRQLIGLAARGGEEAYAQLCGKMRG